MLFSLRMWPPGRRNRECVCVCVPPHTDRPGMGPWRPSRGDPRTLAECPNFGRVPKMGRGGLSRGSPGAMMAQIGTLAKMRRDGGDGERRETSSPPSRHIFGSVPKMGRDGGDGLSRGPPPSPPTGGSPLQAQARAKTQAQTQYSSLPAFGNRFFFKA